MKKFKIGIIALLILCAGAITYVQLQVKGNNIAQDKDGIFYKADGIKSDGTSTVPEGEEPQEQFLIIGDMQQPEELESAFIGHKQGDNIDGVLVNYPKDEKYGELSGQTVTYNILLDRIKKCTADDFVCYETNNAGYKDILKAKQEAVKFEKEANKYIEEGNKELEKGNIDKAKEKQILAQEAASSSAAESRKILESLKNVTRPDLKEITVILKNESETAANNAQENTTTLLNAINEKEKIV